MQIQQCRHQSKQTLNHVLKPQTWFFLPKHVNQTGTKNTSK